MTRQFLLLPPALLLLVSCGKPDTQVAREQSESPPALIERALREGKEDTRVDDSEEPVVPPREALAEALRIEAGPEREKAVAEVAWNAIETEPEVAHEAFRHLTADSPEKIRLLRHYAMTLAGESPEEALEWAEARGTEAERAAAKSQVALALAETDPAGAATLLSESGLVGRDLEVATVQVIQRWAAKSPSEAAAWVAMFEPGAAREAGSRAVAERWLTRDAAAAFGWLGALQDPEHRKETARAMEEVILQQPKEIRELWLEKANAGIRAELEAQREAAMKQVGDNVPPEAK